MIPNMHIKLLAKNEVQATSKWGERQKTKINISELNPAHVIVLISFWGTRVSLLILQYLANEI